MEAFEEVLDLRQHLLISHGLGRLVDVHHHGPLEVGDGAGYGVYAVVVDQCPAMPCKSRAPLRVLEVCHVVVPQQS
jgi:hypothetical protein